MTIRTSAVSGLFRRTPRYRGSLRNFSVFVPKSRQIGKVVVGLIPAPAMYKSLSFGTQLKKKKERYRKNILVTVFQWIWEVHWHQGHQDRGYESLELFCFVKNTSAKSGRIFIPSVTTAILAACPAYQDLRTWRI
jgi:hypothetical protein